MDGARAVLARLAAVTGGVLLPCEADAPDRVRALLEAIAVYAVGGLKLSQVPNDTDKVSLSDISVVENTDPLVTLLRTAVKTGMGIAGLRFSRNTINGHFIEDAYLYRVT